MRELQAEAERLVAAVKPWRPFSLAAAEDCAELLYEHLQLPPPPSATLGRRGKRSTKVRPSPVRDGLLLCPAASLVLSRCCATLTTAATTDYDGTSLFS